MQCTAHSKHSKLQCKRHAIEGGNVCQMHGGAAPQVKLAARERILALVDPALAKLHHALKPRKGVPTAQEIVAARDILDRAGHKAPEQVDVVVGPSLADILRRREEREQDK